MKKRIALLIISLVLLGIVAVSLSTGAPTEDDLYGTWEGKFQDTEFQFIFNPDATCILLFKNTASGETDRLDGTYEVDFSKSPIPLYVVNITQLNYGLYTVMKFSGKDCIAIADFAESRGLRPISFEDSPRMVLNRVTGN